MAVADLQAWADQLQAVRLPAIETQLSDTATELSAKSQEFTDRLDAHAAQIGAVQSGANTALDDASRAITRIYQTGLDAQTYTDAEIQKLRDQLAGSVQAVQDHIDGPLQDEIDEKVEQNLPTLQGAVNQALADAQAIQDAINAKMLAFEEVSDDLFDSTLPVIQQEVAAVQQAMVQYQDQLTQVLTDFPYPSLIQGMDEIKLETEKAFLALDEVILRKPATAWTNQPTLDEPGPKPPLPASWFIEDDFNFRECAELPLGSSDSVGQAYPVAFDPHRIYRVTARLKVVDDGDGSGTLLAMGASTWEGSTRADAATSKGVTETPRQIVDGVVTVSAYFSADKDLLEDQGFSVGGTAASEARHLAASGSATAAFFYLTQNPGAATSGQIRLESLKVEDVTDATLATLSARADKAAAEAAAEAAELAKDDAQTAATSADNAASAAAGSAQTAVTKSDEAGQAATAAAASATEAETARSGAETAVTQATSARDSAAGSASAAQTNADAAAQSANDADEAATAASGFEQSASTSATEAAQSATAANNAQTAAETARTNAETAQTAAVSAKQDAETAAAAAGTSETNAAQSATTAGEQADAASSAASTAATQATDAGQYAQAADSARNLAETAAGSASTSAGSAAQSATDADGARASALQYSNLAASVVSHAGTGVLSSIYMGDFWTNWSLAATRVDNELYPVGQSISFDLAQDVNAGLRLKDDASEWTGQVNADAYVVVVDYELVSGSLDGAGIRFDWNTLPSGEDYDLKSLEEMTSGPIETGKVLTARGTFVRPEQTEPFRDHDVYLFASYPGLGDRAAKHIKFHKVEIRVATAEEMGEGEVKAALEEYAYAKASVDDAMALLRTDLTTSIGSLSASVSAQQTAITTMQGNASAGYLIKAQADGEVSLLELVAADGSAGAVSVARLEASLILLDGTVTTQQLSVGFGRNLFANTDFSSGLDNWDYYVNGANMSAQTSLRVREPGMSYAGQDYPTVFLYQNGTETDGYADFRCQMIVDAAGNTARGTRVEAGKFYELSCHFSLHRCTGQLRIQWMDKNGDTIRYDGPVSIPNQSNSGDDPDQWPPLVVRGKAPIGAVRATIHARKFGTASGVNSYMFIHKPQLAETVENATELVPYDVGTSTLITGNGVVANSITVRHLAAEVFSADNITAGTMSIKRVTVDETLSLDAENAGFAAGKLSAFDTADGIYFGRTVDENGDPGFGFSMSREAPSGNVESIKATSEGLRITNAQHFRELAEVAAPVSLVTTQTWNIPGGTETIDLQIMGAGGGGAGGDADDNQPNSNGADGGSTIVNLYDGVTLIKTWTSPGAEGGRASSGNSSGNNGVGSQWGSGGAGGIGGHFEQYDYGGGGPYVPPTAGGDATGYGAGGGGGGAEATGDEGGRGGKASQILSVQGYDVSGLSDPKLTIVIGAGGAGGPGHNGLDKPGGDGSPGRVDVVAVGTRPTRADVIPLTPQFTGTFGGHGPFPDHGAGLWIIHANGDYLGLGEVENNDSGQTLRFNQNGITTFHSSKTPIVLTTPYSERTLHYQFFKMGD